MLKTAMDIRQNLSCRRSTVLALLGSFNSIESTGRRFLRADSKGSADHVIFSGIQPTGVPHLGNYLGALQQWVKLQDTAGPSTKLLYSIVDLHAITAPQDPRRLKQWKRESLATLFAIGLDPDRSVLFYQSSVSIQSAVTPYSNRTQVPAHSELMWILSCTASMGYLSRMTQWKVRWITLFSLACTCLILSYRASSPYQMMHHLSTEAAGRNLSLVCSLIPFFRRQISWCTGLSLFMLIPSLTANYFLQGDACSCRRGPESTSRICSRMRDKLQSRLWLAPGGSADDSV